MSYVKRFLRPSEKKKKGTDKKKGRRRRLRRRSLRSIGASGRHSVRHIDAGGWGSPGAEAWTLLYEIRTNSWTPAFQSTMNSHLASQPGPPPRPPASTPRRGYVRYPLFPVIIIGSRLHTPVSRDLEERMVRGTEGEAAFAVTSSVFLDTPRRTLSSTVYNYRAPGRSRNILAAYLPGPFRGCFPATSGWLG